MNESNFDNKTNILWSKNKNSMMMVLVAITIIIVIIMLMNLRKLTNLILSKKYLFLIDQARYWFFQIHFIKKLDLFGILHWLTLYSSRRIIHNSQFKCNVNHFLTQTMNIVSLTDKLISQHFQQQIMSLTHSRSKSALRVISNHFKEKTESLTVLHF